MTRPVVERFAMLVSWHILWQGLARTWEPLVQAREFGIPFSEGGYQTWLTWRAAVVLVALAAFPMAARPHPTPRWQVAWLTAGALAWRFTVAWFHYLATAELPRQDPNDMDIVVWESWGRAREPYEAYCELQFNVPLVVACVALTPIVARWIVRLLMRD